MSDPSGPPSLYEGLAEFHDLFMVEPWERLRPHVRAAFAHFADDAVIVEIGAGTGMGTRTIAEECPARIAGLEPDLVMRSILTARVADDPGLARRVTVIAGSAPDDVDLLPTPFDGFVCAHMLGHLDQSQRLRLFEWIDANLREDGIGLITTQERGATNRETGDSPDSEFMQRRSLGQYEYRAYYQETAAADAFSSRYEVWHGDDRIRRAEFVGSWRTVTADDIAGELGRLRLGVEPLDLGVALIRSEPATAAAERTH